jgi:hypothetical protein
MACLVCLHAYIICSCLTSGWKYNNNAFDKVLPWMYLGRGDLASNCQFLEKNGFTDMNKSVKNSHPSKFVYKRIPIDDKDTSAPSLILSGEWRCVGGRYTYTAPWGPRGECRGGGREGVQLFRFVFSLLH